MGLSTKHVASLGAFVIVGVLAFFVGFTPFLIEKEYFTLPQASLIACALTIMSFICFLIEKIEDGKEQDERDRQMTELIEEVRNLQKRQPTLPDEQLKKLDDALEIAKALALARSKSPEAGRAAIQAVIKGAASSLLTLGDAGGPGVLALATKEFVNTLTQRDNLRKAAYLLASAALAVKKAPDSGKPNPPAN